MAGAPRVHAGTGAEVITHEDYLAAITVAVCEQYPTTAAALSQVQLVFGVGLRQRALTTILPCRGRGSG